MAKQLVISGLRRRLSTWVDGGAQLEVQVNNGSVELSELQLRPDALDEAASSVGFSVSVQHSCITCLSLQWSWTGLLSRPVRVTAAGVEIRLAVARSQQRVVQGSGRVEEQAAASTSGILGSLARRIWDQMQVSLTEVHVACEVKEMTTLRDCGTIGILADSLTIASRPVDEGLAQNIDLQNLGIYLLPQGQTTPRDHFVLLPTSPASYAVRRSGRRFTDWRGLEVNLSMGSPELRWSREQHSCFVEMKRCFLMSSSTDVDIPGNDAEGQQVGLCTAATQEKADDPGQSSWRWSSLRHWWNKEPSPPPVEEIPEDISESDRALLTAREGPPNEAAGSRLEVCWAHASLTSADGHLTVHGSGRTTMVLDGEGAWQVDCSLSGTRVKDHSATLPVCGRRGAEAEDAENDILIHVDAQSLQATVRPFDVALTSRALQVVRGLMETAAAVPVQMPEVAEVAKVAASEMSLLKLSITLEQPRLLLRDYSQGSSSGHLLLIFEAGSVGVHRQAGPLQLRASSARAALRPADSAIDAACDEAQILAPCELTVALEGCGAVAELPRLALSLSPAHLRCCASLGRWLAEECRGCGAAAGAALQPRGPGAESPAGGRASAGALGTLSASVGSFRVVLEGSAPLLAVGRLQISSEDLQSARVTGSLSASRGEGAAQELLQGCNWEVLWSQQKTSASCRAGTSLRCTSADLENLMAMRREWAAVLGPAQEADIQEGGHFALTVPEVAITILAAQDVVIQATAHATLAGVGTAWRADCGFTGIVIRDGQATVPICVRRDDGGGDDLSILAVPDSIKVNVRPFMFAPTRDSIQALWSLAQSMTSDPSAPSTGHRTLLRVSVEKPKLLLRVTEQGPMFCLEATDMCMDQREERVEISIHAYQARFGSGAPASLVKSGIMEPTDVAVNIDERSLSVRIPVASVQVSPPQFACLLSLSEWLAKEFPALPRGAEASQPASPSAAASREGARPSGAASPEPPRSCSLAVGSLSVLLAGPSPLLLVGSAEASGGGPSGAAASASLSGLSASLGRGAAAREVLRGCGGRLLWAGEAVSVSCEAGAALRCTEDDARALRGLGEEWTEALNRTPPEAENAGRVRFEAVVPKVDIAISTAGNVTAHAMGHMSLVCAEGAWRVDCGFTETLIQDCQASLPVCRRRVGEHGGVCSQELDDISIFADTASVQVTLRSFDFAPTKAFIQALRSLIRPQTVGRSAAQSSQSPTPPTFRVLVEQPRLLLKGVGEHPALCLEADKLCAGTSTECVDVNIQGCRAVFGSGAPDPLAGTCILAPLELLVKVDGGKVAARIPSADVSVHPSQLPCLLSVSRWLARELLAEPSDPEPAPPEPAPPRGGAAPPRAGAREGDPARGAASLAVESLRVSLSGSAALALSGSLEGSAGGSGLRLRASLEASLGDGEGAAALRDCSGELRWDGGRLTASCEASAALECAVKDIHGARRFAREWADALGQVQGAENAEQGLMEADCAEARITIRAEKLSMSTALRVKYAAGGMWELKGSLGRLLVCEGSDAPPLCDGERSPICADVLATRVHADTRALRVDVGRLELAPGRGALQTLKLLLAELPARPSAAPSKEDGGPARALAVSVKQLRLLLHGDGDGHKLALEADSLRASSEQERTAAAGPSLELCGGRLLLLRPAEASSVVLESFGLATRFEEGGATSCIPKAKLRVSPADLPGLISVSRWLAKEFCGSEPLVSTTCAAASEPPPAAGSSAFRMVVRMFEITVPGAATLVLDGGIDVSVDRGRVWNMRMIVDLGAVLQVHGDARRILADHQWEILWQAEEIAARCRTGIEVTCTMDQLPSLCSSVQEWASARSGVPTLPGLGGDAAGQVTVTLSSVTVSLAEGANDRARAGALAVNNCSFCCATGGQCCLKLAGGEATASNSPGPVRWTELSLSFAELWRWQATLGSLRLTSVDGSPAVQMRGFDAASKRQGCSPSGAPGWHVGGGLGAVEVHTTDAFLEECLEAFRQLGMRLSHVVGADAPPEKHLVSLELRPLRVNLERLAVTKAKLGVEVEKGIVELAAVSIPSHHGTIADLCSKLAAAYKKDLHAKAPGLLGSLSIAGFTAEDAATGCLGTAVGGLALGGAVGGVVGVAAVKGVAGLASASLTKGKELRGGDNGYAFGDATRGLVALSQEQGPASAVVSFAQREQLASSSAGAALGGAVGLVAGPVGSAAGMALGATAGRKLSDTVSSTIQKGKDSRGAAASSGYQFGDFTRGVVSAVTGSEARQSTETAQPGKWRYDDINALAKRNPLRFSEKASVTELQKDIAENAALGRPIYMEIQTRGSRVPTCRVCKNKMVAIDWLRGLEAPPAIHRSPASSHHLQPAALAQQTSRPDMTEARVSEVHSVNTLDLLDLGSSSAACPTSDLLDLTGPEEPPSSSVAREPAVQDLLGLQIPAAPAQAVSVSDCFRPVATGQDGGPRGSAHGPFAPSSGSCSAAAGYPPKAVPMHAATPPLDPLAVGAAAQRSAGQAAAPTVTLDAAQGLVHPLAKPPTSSQKSSRSDAAGDLMQSILQNL